MFLFVIYEEIFNIIEFIDNLDGSFLMSGFDMMCYSLMVFLVEIDIDIGEIIEIFFVYFDFDVDYDFDFQSFIKRVYSMSELGVKKQMKKMLCGCFVDKNVVKLKSFQILEINIDDVFIVKGEGNFVCVFFVYELWVLKFL